jgi:hypothetical protein
MTENCPVQQEKIDPPDVSGLRPRWSIPLNRVDMSKVLKRLKPRFEELNERCQFLCLRRAKEFNIDWDSL